MNQLLIISKSYATVQSSPIEHDIWYYTSDINAAMWLVKR